MYTGQHLYGNYNPYSPQNLQSINPQLSGGPVTDTVNAIYGPQSGGGGLMAGQVAPDGYSPNQYGLGAAADDATYGRLGQSLGSTAFNAAKNMALGGAVNPASVMSGLFGAGYNAAGIEAPKGLMGSITSRVPAVVGSLLGGPAMGLMGSMVGTPFADAIGDFSDTRENESLRDSIEDHYGQVSGRKGYSDLRGAVNNDQALKDTASIADALSKARQTASLAELSPKEKEKWSNAVAQLEAFNAAMQQPAPERAVHNWGINPFGGMTSQMEANMRGKYGPGWGRDPFGNIETKEQREARANQSQTSRDHGWGAHDPKGFGGGYAGGGSHSSQGSSGARGEGSGQGMGGGDHSAGGTR